MNISTAELHVRAITRDTLTEEASDRILADEQWLAREIDLVLSEVSRAEERDPESGLARGLDAYADDLRERLREAQPESLITDEEVVEEEE